MKRLIFQSLNEWKTSPRRKPLILRGARQVGKTYILRAFASVAYEHYVYFNFEDEPLLRQFFEPDLDPLRIIKQLAVHSGISINPETTLIIFDEIQECPEALNSLKYFNEKANQYHVCAAGSLLGVKLANTKGFPVGKVNFLHLHPMSFAEFLWAAGEESLYNYLLSLETIQPLPELFHNKLNQLLKVYLFTGGMPEAVSTYFSSEDITAVREVQREILRSYQLDFSKHTTSSQTMKISQVWDSMPSQLAKENKKFIYSVVRKSARAREYEEAIQWLTEAGIVNKVQLLSGVKLPLKAYTDPNVFKLYLVDVGILNALARLKPNLLVDGDRLFQEFKGSLIENFVSQELNVKEEELYYWASEGRAEVDFVVSESNAIYPLEVKSGMVTKSKSLRIYAEKFTPNYTVRLTPKNLTLDGNMLNIPLYLAGELKRIFDLLPHNPIKPNN